MNGGSKKGKYLGIVNNDLDFFQQACTFFSHFFKEKNIIWQLYGL